MSRTRPVVEKLAEQACWDLLAAATLGRVAMVAGEGVDIFPVNFFVRDRLIFFRSAPGSKLVELTKNPIVAFEIDGTTRDTSWSVVTKGRANRMGSDLEIEKSGVLRLHSVNPTEKWNYVQIVPETVTGRRFRTSRQPSLDTVKESLV